MRGMARAVAFGLAIAFLAGACGGAGTGGTAGTSSPAASAATRPKFEVQTFMYSIQVKGKLRVGTQEDNPPFSVKNPTNSKWEGFDTDIGREIAEVVDLGGKTFCAQRGSTSEQNVTKAQPAAKALLLDSYPACLLALQQGQADAVSTDETILFGLVKQDPNTKIVGKYFSDEPY